VQQNVPKIPAESFEQAYKEYQAELRRFFEMQAHERNSVEDLVQKVYVQLLRGRSRETVREPKKYLYRCAWRVLYEENRRVRRDQRRSVSGDAERWDLLARYGGALWVEDDSHTELALDQCRRALEKLPPTHQAALLLQYRDGRTYEEIARDMKVTPHAVKKYIGRALSEIRNQLNPTNVDP